MLLSFPLSGAPGALFWLRLGLRRNGHLRLLVPGEDLRDEVGLREPGVGAEELAHGGIRLLAPYKNRNAIRNRSGRACCGDCTG